MPGLGPPGRADRHADREFTQHVPRPGWVEHDAGELRDMSHAVAGEALDDAGVAPGELEAIGVANQRETVVCRDPSTGEPLHHAVVWQDRRTAGRCHELREAGEEERIRSRTGLVLDPASRPPRSNGSCATWTGSSSAPARAAPCSGRSTRGCCPSCAASTSPIPRTPRARCCSTSRRENGRPSCSSCSACRSARCRYALEAAIFVTGAAVQGLRDGLGIIEAAAETEGLARSLDSNDGVYFVPALTALGSPHRDPYARGTLVGLTRGTGRAHLARAALEAMAYQAVDVVRAWRPPAASRWPSCAPTARPPSTAG